VNRAQAARLRESLLDPREATLIELHASARAAVLVPLHERNGEICAVFTRRRDHLRRHAGQISFPGGGEEPGDGDLIATALRETTEEIGLHADAVTLLGALSPVSVRVSGFALYPFVGAIERPAQWIPAAAEVEAILELALAELARSYAVQTVRRAARTIVTPTFDAGGELLWGATARILTDLLIRMGLLGAG
jgi:8-oxo-dGTP pyrophosphatase MutT (NUDIX family)